MDGKSIIALGILLAMFILCIAVLILFKNYMNKTVLADNNSPDKKKKNAYNAGDLLKTAEWLGKSAEEAGLDSRYVSSDGGSFKIDLSGELFKKSAEGTAHFYQPEGEIVNRISSISISGALDFDECKSALEALYGKAQSEAEGSCSFGGDGFTAELSKSGEASELKLY